MVRADLGAPIGEVISMAGKCKGEKGKKSGKGKGKK